MIAKTFSVPACLVCGILIAGGLFAADDPPAPVPPTKYTYIKDSPDPARVGKPPLAPMKFTFVDSADPSAAAIAQYGYRKIDEIGTLLVTEVDHELATSETSEAVAVLHLKNLELPKPVPGKPTITAIKRTSLLLRNPLNAPDAADEAALEMIHNQLMDDRSPDKMLVQRVEHAGMPDEWRVYRPIAALPSCLACHGDPKTFRPGVKEALDRLYPEDKANDYAASEYRGVIRVSVAPAAPTAK